MMMELKSMVSECESEIEMQIETIVFWYNLYTPLRQPCTFNPSLNSSLISIKIIHAVPNPKPLL